MNYRHAFHAGNHADVLKHIALLALIDSTGTPFNTDSLTEDYDVARAWASWACPSI
ncbi:hypothetical protein HH297_16925, partial [Xanthomonas sp. Kuri4-3]